MLLIANVDDAPRDASSAASGGERRRAAASGGEGTKGTIGICTKFKIGGLMSIFAIAAAHWGPPDGKHKIIEIPHLGLDFASATALTLGTQSNFLK